MDEPLVGCDRLRAMKRRCDLRQGTGCPCFAFDCAIPGTETRALVRRAIAEDWDEPLPLDSPWRQELAIMEKVRT